MKKSKLVVLMFILAAMILSTFTIVLAEDSSAESGEILAVNYKTGGQKAAYVPGGQINAVYVNKAVYDNARTEGSDKRAFIIGALFEGEMLSEVAIGNGCALQTVAGKDYYSISFQNSGVLELPSATEGKDYSAKFFVFYDNKDIKPISKSCEYEYMKSPAVTAYANGVKLNWDQVDGASGYTIYRDDAVIATVTDNEYKDVYFKTVEQLVGDTDKGLASGITKDNITQNHNYSVRANFTDKNTIVNSDTVICSADTSKMRYLSLNGITSDKYQENYNSCSNVLSMSASSDALKSITKGDSEAVALGTNTDITTKYTSAAGSGTYIGEFGGKAAIGLVGVKGSSDFRSSINLYLPENTLSADKQYKVLINMAALGKGNATNKLHMFGEVFFVGDKNTKTTVDGESVADTGFFGARDAGAALTRINSEGVAENIQTFNNNGRIYVGDNSYYTYILDSKVKFNTGSDNRQYISATAIHLAGSYKVYYNADGENAAIRSIAIIDPEDYLE